MDAPSIPPTSPTIAAPAGDGRLRELERDLRSHRYLLHLVMGALTVLLVTSSIALFHQIRWLLAQANQLNATTQELSKAVGDYQTNAAPQMQRMFDELRRYAVTDPDFSAIFSKYRVVGNGSQTNAPAAPTPGK